MVVEARSAPVEADAAEGDDFFLAVVERPDDPDELEPDDPTPLDSFDEPGFEPAAFSAAFLTLASAGTVGDVVVVDAVLSAT